MGGGGLICILCHDMCARVEVDLFVFCVMACVHRWMGLIVHTCAVLLCALYCMYAVLLCASYCMQSVLCALYCMYAVLLCAGWRGAYLCVYNDMCTGGGRLICVRVMTCVHGWRWAYLCFVS